MVKYCCFIWTQEPILKPSVAWSKLGFGEDWVCQLLIECVNSKTRLRKKLTVPSVGESVPLFCSLLKREAIKKQEKRKKRSPLLLGTPFLLYPPTLKTHMLRILKMAGFFPPPGGRRWILTHRKGPSSHPNPVPFTPQFKKRNRTT